MVHVLNNGRSHSVQLKRGLREVAYLLAEGECEMVVQYIPTKENIIPDKLSRMFSSNTQQVPEVETLLNPQEFSRVKLNANVFMYSQCW